MTTNPTHSAPDTDEPMDSTDNVIMMISFSTPDTDSVSAEVAAMNAYEAMLRAQASTQLAATRGADACRSPESVTMLENSRIEAGTQSKIADAGATMARTLSASSLTCRDCSNVCRRMYRALSAKILSTCSARPCGCNSGDPRSDRMTPAQIARTVAAMRRDNNSTPTRRHANRVYDRGIKRF